MRLKTLNGAPLCAELDFSPEVLLHPDAATQFLHDDYIPSVDDSPLKWRHLPSKEHRLRSGWSQPYLPGGALHGSNPASFSVPGIGTSFDLGQEDTANLDTTMTIQEPTFDDSEFVQHSLIFHDTLESSQIASGGAADRTVSSSSFMSTSFDTTSSDLDSFQHSNADGPILQVPTTLKLTSLGSLPGAAHLRSIYPQTPTPNILCVLAAPPEDKDVFVKKGGYRMQLRELTVADDTRSGFRVSFWQRPSNRGDSQNALNQTLQLVRAGDILLLRNIALNAFQNDVYGQSLNPSITRVRTSVEVLMSGGGISTRQLGALPATVVAAFRRVKKWANVHVASGAGGPKKRRGDPGTSSRFSKRALRSADQDETLPPDTMEPV